jgi:hypothetical protein
LVCSECVAIRECSRLEDAAIQLRSRANSPCEYVPICPPELDVNSSVVQASTRFHSATAAPKKILVWRLTRSVRRIGAERRIRAYRCRRGLRRLARHPSISAQLKAPPRVLNPGGRSSLRLPNPVGDNSLNRSCPARDLPRKLALFCPNVYGRALYRYPIGELWFPPWKET